MNRRDFVTTLGIGAAALVMPKITMPFSDSRPQIAITIDDFNLFKASPSIAEKRNRALLAALRAHSNLKAGSVHCRAGTLIVKRGRAWSENGAQLDT